MLNKKNQKKKSVVHHGPSERAGSDLNRLRSTGQKHAWWFLHTSLLRTRSVRPNRTWDGLAQYDPGRVWKNAFKSASGKLVAVQFCQNQAPMILAMLACFWIVYVWPNSDQAIQIGTQPVLHNMVQAFGRTEPSQMREVRPSRYDMPWFWLHAGHNQNTFELDPACLLGENVHRCHGCGLQTLSKWHLLYWTCSLVCVHQVL